MSKTEIQSQNTALDIKVKISQFKAASTCSCCGTISPLLYGAKRVLLRTLTDAREIEVNKRKNVYT